MRGYRLAAAVAFSLVTAYPGLAQAGNGASGGGKGVVCRSSNGRVKSVELLDLWEAREIYQRKTAPSREPVRAQVAAAIQRLKFTADANQSEARSVPGKPSVTITFPDVLAEQLQLLADPFLGPASNVVRLRGKTLAPTEDSYESAYPRDCAVEQLVNYIDAYNAPRILVNQDLVDKMNPVNQAALIVHEAFYAYLRSASREADSIRARRAVGFVFAGNSFPSNGWISQVPHGVCQASDPKDAATFFYVYEKDGLAIPQNLVTGGTLALGFQLPTEPYALDSWANFVAGTCAPLELGASGPNPGVGPVDFTQMHWINTRCSEGKSNYEIVSGNPNPGFGAPTAIPLVCYQVAAREGPGGALGPIIGH